MFKVEEEQKNNIKPWMIAGNNDWVYILGTIISVPMLLWGTAESFLRKNWFSFIWLIVALLLFVWMVPKFIKIRHTIITKFGSDDWMEEILFNDNEIVITESGSKGSYTNKRRYDEITEIVEDRGVISLKMKTLPNINFSKDKFAIGSWEECKQFIDGKCAYKG